MLVTGARQRLRGGAGAFVETWRNRDLRSAQLAFTGSVTGEWAFTVGIGVYAYRHGGAPAVGVVSLLRMLPSAFIAPVIAPAADGRRRERVLAAVSLVRSTATGLAALFVAVGASPLGVYAMAIVAAAAAVLYRPVHSALLPMLCRTPRQLAGSNVVRGMLDSVATLTGPAAAAVLLETSGVAAVFAAAAGALLMSAVTILPVKPEGPMTAETAASGGGWSRVVDGLRAVAGGRELRLLVGLAGVQTLMRGALTVFSVVVAIDLLGTGAPGVGALGAAVGVGAVVGSCTASLLIGTRRLARWFGIGVALWGLPLAVLGTAPSQPAALALLACVGVGNALVDVGVFTLLARLAPDAIMARVFAALESVIALTVGVGALLAPFAIQQIGLRGALVVFGLFSPVVVAMCWRRLRVLDLAMVGRDRDVDLLRATPILESLPLPLIEQLARGLEPVVVAAGVAVFEQGDAGDRCYFIDDGVADVVGDGHVIATLGAGEGFGEIALLRQVPRTATVIARRELRLESLTAERFVGVVTGFRTSADEADVHVDGMLHRFTPTVTTPTTDDWAGDG